MSADRLAEALTARRARYDAARASSLSLSAVEPRIRAAFRALKQLYPEAVFPDVYFVIGRLNSGGTISDRALIIGAEMYPDHGGVPHIVAHELIHYQQLATRRGGPKTLLAQSILEGSADFVAEMISGKHINPRAHEYGIAHEPQLWREFQAQMHASDNAGWLYGGAPDGRPADLGYFVGYRIAQAYYDRAADKRRALREVLRVNDFERFLEASGYGSSW